MNFFVVVDGVFLANQSVMVAQAVIMTPMKNFVVSLIMTVKTKDFKLTFSDTNEFLYLFHTTRQKCYSAIK